MTKKKRKKTKVPNLKSLNSVKLLLILKIFILILTMGLIYEWKKEKLNDQSGWVEFLCKKIKFITPTINIAQKIQ